MGATLRTVQNLGAKKIASLGCLKENEAIIL